MTGLAFVLFLAAVTVVPTALYMGWRSGRSKERRHAIQEAEKAKARNDIIERWTCAIDPSYGAPLYPHVAEGLTKQMRADLNKTLALLRQARREWTPTQGPTDLWCRNTETLLRQARGEWPDPGDGTSDS